MSSINEVLEEEKSAEALLRDAQATAETMLKEAKVNAEAIVKKAQSDDTLLKELSSRHNERIAVQRGEVLAECQRKVAEIENLCRRNLESAVKLIVDNVLGAEFE